MKRYQKGMIWLLVLLLTVLPLTGCSDPENAGAEPADPAPAAAAEDHSPTAAAQAPVFDLSAYTLQAAADYDEVAALFTRINSAMTEAGAEGTGVVDAFFAAGDKPVFGGNYGERSRSTQRLPAGVLQADRVAAAEGYLYRVQDGELMILEAKGADSAVVSTTTVSNTAEGYESYEERADAVLVQGEMAAVITHVYGWKTAQTDGEGWSSETVSQSHVKFYDVTDKTAPVLVSDYVQDGSCLGAYLIGSRIYLLTDYHVMKLEETEPASFVPKVGAAGALQPLSAQKLLLNEQTDAMQYTVIGALSVPDGALADAVALTGSFHPCFASADRMILTGSCYATMVSEPYEENQYQVTAYSSRAITLAAEFSLTDGIAMTKTSCVDGRLPDPGQVDWDNGYLRMVTMTQGYTNRLFEDEAMGFSNVEMGEHQISNAVYILDETLTPVGELTGLSDGALSYYARLVGTTGYMIAYDAQQPVYTLDLTEPTAPEVGQTLDAADPVEILLRWDEQLLGITAGGKLQLLQAAGAELSVLAEAELGDQYAAVRYHADSILCDSASGLLVLPHSDGLHLYTITDTQIAESGSVDVPVSARTRAVLLEGCLYITGDAGCTVADPATGEVLTQVAVAVG